jgi:hypothetical protein
MSPNLPLNQDPDYLTSYADGFFLKLDHETHTVRLVFYKNELRLPNELRETVVDTLPDNLVKNLIFEVRIPNSALTGLLDISYIFNKYREETDNEEAMSDEGIAISKQILPLEIRLKTNIKEETRSPICLP